MNTRIFVPALLSAVMLSTPLLAASARHEGSPTEDRGERAIAMTPAEQCVSLENQFDSAIKMHMNAAKADQAKAMRTEGGKLCATGEQIDGIAKLQLALKDIGVRAKY